MPSKSPSMAGKPKVRKLIDELWEEYKPELFDALAEISEEIVERTPGVEISEPETYRIDKPRKYELGWRSELIFKGRPVAVIRSLIDSSYGSPQAAFRVVANWLHKTEYGVPKTIDAIFPILRQARGIYPEGKRIHIFTALSVLLDPSEWRKFATKVRKDLKEEFGEKGFGTKDWTPLR